jgi:ATP-dependent helicase/nuclease subunit B
MMPSMLRRIVSAASAAARLAEAQAWLERRASSEPLLIVAATGAAAGELLRGAAATRGSSFGWYQSTLGRLAGQLAAPQLAAHGRAVLGALSAQALAARVIFKVGARSLGRYSPVADRPGFAVAVARTLEELRLAGTSAREVAAHDADLARLQEVYERELEAAALADRATVFRLAIAAAEAARAAPSPPLGLGLLLLDLALSSVAERDLVAALAATSPEVLALVPAGDERAARQLETALDTSCVAGDGDEPSRALSRLQRHLFIEETPPVAALDDSVSFFSAPGENRECVEIARRVLAEAERGVPFDRMAILVHAVADYRRHLEEAFGRAQIPVYFVGGSLAPDPSGRAFVALLGCVAEGLSARRFAEFLSLGELPSAAPDGGPPESLPASERWVPPDDELVTTAVAESTTSARLAAREEQADDEDTQPTSDDPSARAVRAGTVRAPRRWERLLNEAAVIGGLERWERRLDGLERDLTHRLEGTEEPNDPVADGVRRSLSDLCALRKFALPLLRLLDELPDHASWGEWLLTLSELATRALRRPQRVLAVLAELAPMGPVGPVGLAEVRLVLGRRLTEVVVPPPQQRYGAVLIAPTEAVRGQGFDVVFVPGLAERLFPRRIIEDPILPDAVRQVLGRLTTNEERVARERLALRLAVGAARQRVYLSYSRLDLLHARPRVPSFYGLEVLRAAQGRLPSFSELSRLAELSSAARLSWPAPQRAMQAIDEAEHDLALLSGVLHDDPTGGAGLVAHLLTSNPHLGRAVRLRAQRWGQRWASADGLVRPSASAKQALAAHALAARSYSPTALQAYAACPYRFLLYAIHRLSPRDEPEPIDEMDPLQRGSLVHEIQFRFFRAMQARGALPVTPSTLDSALAELDRVVAEVAEHYRELFAPAIARVWDDGIAAVRADLRRWVQLAAADRSGWIPWRFEFAFGMPAGHAGLEAEMQDPASTPQPAALEGGICLRGKIDLIERNADGKLRVTDHKTGRARVRKGAVIEGGQALQPVLYALTVEQLLAASVESGRLYYCTMAGGYEERVVPLDDRSRDASRRVAQTIGLALERGFLPAAPTERACEYCDYLCVCGPYEEYRVRRKNKRALQELLELRELP